MGVTMGLQMVVDGRYELGREIGAGGSGTVYRATDRTMGRTVAVKIFHVRDEEAIERFQREARVAALIRVPDVVAILDSGRDGDRAYIVMELLEGKTLAQVMHKAPPLRQRALQIVRRLTATLALLHSRGIVHRDVTPNNVFLTDDGRVVLSDFGLAAVEDRDARTTLTRAGLVVGTPRYMAPEALYGRPLDARVDVYAVGAILYELLLGRRPVSESFQSSRLEGPRLIDPGFPPALAKVILRALERDPADRFPTANELHAALNLAILDDELPPEPPPRLRRFHAAPFASGRFVLGMHGFVSLLALLVWLRSPLFAFFLMGMNWIIVGVGLFRRRRHAEDIGGTPQDTLSGEIGKETGKELDNRGGLAAMPAPEGPNGGIRRSRPRVPALDSGPRRSMGTAPRVRLDDPELRLHPDTFGELLVLQGADQGAHYPLSGTTFLGRKSVDRDPDPEPDILIDDPVVSRLHARIGIDDSRVFLEDCGSSNGTFLNDRLVERVFLKNGDQICIGKTVFLYSGPAAARRVQELAVRWRDLMASVTPMFDDEAFVAASRRLAHGQLREAIGYRIDREVPLHRAFVGFVVDAPTLWIRQRRFALIFVALHEERGNVLQELNEFLEGGQVYEHLIVAIPVGGPGQIPPSLAAHHHSMGLSVRRFDLVMLDAAALQWLVRANTAEQFLKIVLDHGLAPAALSPYVLRGPVPEHMFFGRGRELKTVAEGLATSSFAVVAGRRMGKSSFLQQLMRMLQSDPRYHTVHINCEARETTARFLDAFESDGITVGDADAFPRRVSKLRAREHGRTIVMLIDEVDALLDNDLGDGRQGNLFRVFRAAAHEGSCRFVFSGSRVLYRHLHDAASPFFNFAEQILLRPIEELAVEEIVETPMRQLGIDLVRAPKLVARVIEVTSCHPNLVQLLCHRVVQGAVDRRATRELVDLVIGDREFQREFVETAWSESTSREKLVSLLFAEDTIAVAELQRRAQERGMGNVALQDALRILELCSLVALQPGSVTFVLKSFPDIVRRFEDVPALVDTLAGVRK